MRSSLAALLVSAAASGASAQNILFNPDFEEPAYLNSGQTQVGVGEQKMFVRDHWLPGYDAGIYGIMDWIHSWSDVGFGEGARDAGLSRADFGGSGETQYAFINNWDTRLSQVTSHSIAAGEVFNASIYVGARGPNQGGRVQLWAGIPNYDNPDIFDSSAVLLADLKVATGDWTVFTPDMVLDEGVWNQALLSVTIPDGSSAIGLPLTMSFLTSGGSWGALNFDAASLEVVPSAGTWALAAIAGFFVFRRAR